MFTPFETCCYTELPSSGCTGLTSADGCYCPWFHRKHLWNLGNYCYCFLRCFDRGRACGGCHRPACDLSWSAFGWNCAFIDEGCCCYSTNAGSALLLRTGVRPLCFVQGASGCSFLNSHGFVRLSLTGCRLRVPIVVNRLVAQVYFHRQQYWLCANLDFHPC